MSAATPARADIPDLAVVGAGIIGITAALAAQARGLSVTILDRDGPAAGASAANAGAFAFTDIFPLASPGILRKAPFWLFDPLGPLSIPPRYAARIAPWMARFAAATLPARFRRATAAQTALMDLSRATLGPFLTSSGTEAMLRREGQLEVYEGRRQFEASLPGWQARAAHGIEFQHLDRADEIAAIQPGLAPVFTHATFTPGWLAISDPLEFALALARHFQERGGRIERAEVRGLTPEASHVAIHHAGGAGTARNVLIATGAHSRTLAAGLGDRIPLETERGYNTTLPEGAFDLRTQITFGGHGFVVTRIGGRVRVGGAVELGGLDFPPDFRRARVMLAKAKRFMPALATEGGAEWMGFRPSLPDSLPVIGRASRAPNVFYAFGHGHLGLTQATGTAALIADLLTGETPAIDLSPFSPTRFRRFP